MAEQKKAGPLRALSATMPYQLGGFASFYFLKIFVYLFIVVLGFELRAYTLSHSTSPFFCDRFFLR
jgi:hypothetical protein